MLCQALSGAPPTRLFAVDLWFDKFLSEGIPMLFCGCCFQRIQTDPIQIGKSSRKDRRKISNDRREVLSLIPNIDRSLSGITPFFRSCFVILHFLAGMRILETVVQILFSSRSYGRLHSGSLRWKVWIQTIERRFTQL